MYIPYEDLHFLLNKTLSQIVIINECNNHWVKIDIDLWNDIKHDNFTEISEEIKSNLIRHGIISKNYKEYIVYKRMMQTDEMIGFNIVFNITDCCNLRCPYCFNESCVTERQKVKKNVEQIVYDLKKLKDLKINTLTISGGEPFLYTSKELIYILEEARKISKKVGINTNGTIIPDELKKILSLCDTISISLDGYNEETNSLTRGKGNFQKTINFIEKVSKFNCLEKLWLSTTASVLNHKHLHYMLDVAKKFNIDLGINFIFEIGSAAENASDLRIKERDEMLLRKNLLEYAAKINYPKYPNEFYYSDVILAKKTCSNANMLFIDDGKIYPCPGMKEKRYELGDLTDITKCLKNRVRNNLLELRSFNRYKYEKCLKCPAKYFCGGGCYAMEMNDERCNYYRKHISYLLWDFDCNISPKENIKKYGKYEYDIQVL